MIVIIMFSKKENLIPYFKHIQTSKLSVATMIKKIGHAEWRKFQHDKIDISFLSLFMKRCWILSL